MTQSINTTYIYKNIDCIFIYITYIYKNTACIYTK